MPWVLLSVAGAFASNATDEALAAHLAARHPVSCDRLIALVDIDASHLTRAADRADGPPWAPLRAAGCAAVLFGPEILPTLERWLVDPQRVGLGRAVLGQLDALPEALAVEVVSIALEGGSDPAFAAKRAAASSLAAVRGVGIDR